MIEELELKYEYVEPGHTIKVTKTLSSDEGLLRTDIVDAFYAFLESAGYVAPQD